MPSELLGEGRGGGRELGIGSLSVCAFNCPFEGMVVKKALLSQHQIACLGLCGNVRELICKHTNTTTQPNGGKQWIRHGSLRVQ